jgi:hypothetical protein
MTSIYIPTRPPREIPPAGMHRAACFTIAELGVQPSIKYGPKPKILFQFETLDIANQAGKPFVLRRTYTETLDPQGALRPDIEGWFGKSLTDTELAELDFADLLGAVWQLGVMHQQSGDKVYANITSVMAPPAGGPKKVKTFYDPVSFSLQARPFAAAEYSALPQWVQTVVSQSPDYRRARQVDGSETVPQITGATPVERAPKTENTYPPLKVHHGSGASQRPSDYDDLGQGVGQRPSIQDDLDDALPFAACDPDAEPYLRRRAVA